MMHNKKLLSKLLALVLSAAVTFSLAGCSDSGKSSVDELADSLATPVGESIPVTELGEGETEFSFEVVDPEGETAYFTVNTDKTVVGDALLDVGLIAGDESEYGLYVKTVNGLTLDYDKDGKYWAFYVDGEYATAGVDSTDIAEGSIYAFKAE